jgi:hypothetical protein
MTSDLSVFQTTISLYSGSGISLNLFTLSSLCHNIDVHVRLLCFGKQGRWFGTPIKRAWFGRFHVTPLIASWMQSLTLSLGPQQYQLLDHLGAAMAPVDQWHGLLARKLKQIRVFGGS